MLVKPVIAINGINITLKLYCTLSNTNRTTLGEKKKNCISTNNHSHRITFVLSAKKAGCFIFFNRSKSRKDNNQKKSETRLRKTK